MTIVLTDHQKEHIRLLVESARMHGKNAADLQKEIDEILKIGMT